MFISFRFKWSNLMDEDEKTVTNNVDEDMASMMFAAGIWHLEHAHLVSVVSFKILHCFEKAVLVTPFLVIVTFLLYNNCRSTRTLQMKKKMKRK